MSPLHAAILGLVQGATEFLPVSSSAHLVLVPTWLGWQNPPLSFDVALHLATALALIVCYWRDLVRLLVGAAVWFISRLRRQPCPEAHAEGAHLAGMVALASIPAAIAGVLLKDVFEKAFENPTGVAVCLLVTGVVLIAGQRWSVRFAGEAVERVGWKDALVIGTAQAVAILPGISRSGSTIVAGLGRKLSRDDAPRFAFLLAVPAILGAGAVHAKELLATASATGAHEVGPAALALGTLVAFATGLLAIRLLLALVRRGRLFVFAFYCWAVGLGTLVWLAVR
jgi:undecaprenyl-diphosphatase